MGTENLVKDIRENPKAFLLQMTVGGLFDLHLSFKTPQLPFARSVFVFSTGTSWLCKNTISCKLCSLLILKALLPGKNPEKKLQ